MSDLAGLLTEYFEWLAVERGLAPNSLAAYRRDLRRYTAYLASIGVDDPADIGEATVHGFVEYLKSIAADDGQPLLAPRRSRGRSSRCAPSRSSAPGRTPRHRPQRRGRRSTRAPGHPKALDEGQVTALLGSMTWATRAQRDRVARSALRPGSASAKQPVSTSTTSTSSGRCCVLGKGDKNAVPIGRIARASARAVPRDGRLIARRLSRRVPTPMPCS
jgi:integrase/recombinase XerD